MYLGTLFFCLNRNALDKQKLTTMYLVFIKPSLSNIRVQFNFIKKPGLVISRKCKDMLQTF